MRPSGVSFYWVRRTTIHSGVVSRHTDSGCIREARNFRRTLTSQSRADRLRVPLISNVKTQMRLSFLIVTGVLVWSGASASDTLPAEKRNAAALPKQARSSQEPPFLTMKDHGCGGEGLHEDSRCLSRYLDWLDSQLNAVYRRALAKLPERDEMDVRKEREQLRKSQRAWLKFKDDNCALVGGLEGGSNLNVTFSGMICMENELKQRIQFLKRIADGE